MKDQTEIFDMRQLIVGQVSETCAANQYDVPKMLPNPVVPSDAMLPSDASVVIKFVNAA